MVLLNLILFLQIFSFSYSRRPVPIGVIFHEENTDAEIVFHNALLRENINNTRLEFILNVRMVDREDSIEAEKIACELASQGVVAIFGPSSVQTSKIVGSICNDLGIPHFITHWIPGEEQNTVEHHKYTRNFFPENNMYARALGKVIDDANWNGFTLIYDNKECLERLQDVLEQKQPKDQPVTMMEMPEDDDYEPLLKQIIKSRETYFVIDCSPDKVEKLFRRAIGVKMMTEYQSYIVTSLDTHILDLDEFKDNLANITTIRIVNPLSMEVTTAIHDWRIEEKRLRESTEIRADKIKTETALLHDAVRMFLTSFNECNAQKDIYPPIQLRCTTTTTHTNKWSQGMQILNHLNERTDAGMTGRIIFDEVGRRKDFYMEMLKLNKGEFMKIATLDLLPEVTINTTRTEEDRILEVAETLQNRTITVAATLVTPFLLEKKPGEGEYLQGNDRYEGFSKDLMQGIASHIGFRYEIKVVSGNGNKDPVTKKWDGLVKELLDRNAQLGLGDLTITYDRRTAVDFTAPFMTLGISILYVKPHKESPPLFSFMSPLSMEVWFLMATAYLCVSVLLFLLAKIAADDWGNPHPCNTESGELVTIWNMHNCIWLTAGSIMQQGCDILPKAISTRLTAGLWWFFALIVISSYTANLAAFITKERMDESIENAEDLAKQSKIHYGTMVKGSTKEFFKNSNFSTYQRMWAFMESTSPSVFVISNDEGVARVLKAKRNYAFLMESSGIEYVVERHCELAQIGELLDSKGYGIAMPMNSPYRTLISKTILRMQEAGTLRSLKDRWWKVPQNMSCSGKKDGEDDDQELKMEKIVGVFFVLAGGLGLAILIGILEFWWNVNKVSISEKITPWKAFKAELLFALDIRVTTKVIHTTSSEKSLSVSNRSSKSLDVDHAVVPEWKFNSDEKQKSKV